MLDTKVYQSDVLSLFLSLYISTQLFRAGSNEIFGKEYPGTGDRDYSVPLLPLITCKMRGEIFQA